MSGNKILKTENDEIGFWRMAKHHIFDAVQDRDCAKSDMPLIVLDLAIFTSIFLLLTADPHLLTVAGLHFTQMLGFELLSVYCHQLPPALSILGNFNLSNSSIHHQFNLHTPYTHYTSFSIPRWILALMDSKTLGRAWALSPSPQCCVTQACFHCWSWRPKWVLIKQRGKQYRIFTYKNRAHSRWPTVCWHTSKTEYIY